MCILCLPVYSPCYIFNTVQCLVRGITHKLPNLQIMETNHPCTGMQFLSNYFTPMANIYIQYKSIPYQPIADSEGEGTPLQVRKKEVFLISLFVHI